MPQGQTGQTLEDTGVPMELVHRRQKSDVLPTTWRRTAEGSYLLQASWPCDHPLYAPDRNGRHDPLLAAETLRQCALLVSHTDLGAPLDHHFSMSRIEFATVPGTLHASGATTLLDVELVCSAVVMRSARVASMTCVAVLRHDGVITAVAAGDMTCTSPAVYRRLRGPDLPPPGYRPPLPGPVRPGSLLAAAGDARHVRVDTSHPFFFQRPNDHVPGMLLLEAAREAAAESVALHSAWVRFHRYAELTSPCVVHTRPLAPARVEVTVTQHELPVFSAVFHGSPCP